jgi:acetoin utilization protein AcuB
MQIFEMMSTNVVSISSDTTLATARKIMDTYDYSRLTVIDRGKLVGIVSKDSLDAGGKAKLTSCSIYEISYMLNTLKVKEVMHRDVVTVSPDMYVDDAMALAESKQIGMLVVVEGNTVTGVVTSYDFFTKILHPLLGLNLPGTRIYVQQCNKAADIEKVMSVIKDFKFTILSQFSNNIPAIGDRHELVLHLDAENCSKCVEEIKKLGYQVIERRIQLPKPI